MDKLLAANHRTCDPTLIQTINSKDAKGLLMREQEGTFIVRHKMKRVKNCNYQLMVG